MPLFIQAVAFNVVGAVLFAKYARLTSPLEDDAEGGDSLCYQGGPVDPTN